MPATEFEVPEGLTELLQQFTVAVLRTHPSNLNVFAREYFERQCITEKDYKNVIVYSDEDSGRSIVATVAGSAPTAAGYKWHSTNIAPD